MRTYISSEDMTARGHGTRVTLWRRSRNPDDPMPAPFRISANRIRWDLEEVEKYEANIERLGPEKKSTSFA